MQANKQRGAGSSSQPRSAEAKEREREREEEEDRTDLVCPLEFADKARLEQRKLSSYYLARASESTVGPRLETGCIITESSLRYLVRPFLVVVNISSDKIETHDIACGFGNLPALPPLASIIFFDDFYQLFFASLSGLVFG